MTAAKMHLSELSQFKLALGVCSRLEEALEAVAGSLVNVNYDAALVHGDFTVDNILVSNGRMLALDMTGRDRNTVYHDLATFLNSIRLLELSWPLAAVHARAHNRSFLNGYFDRSDFDRRALWFLRVAGLLASAVEILARRRDQWVARLWLRLFFSRLLNEYQRCGEYVR